MYYYYYSIILDLVGLHAVADLGAPGARALPYKNILKNNTVKFDKN